jgi:uridine kinase
MISQDSFYLDLNEADKEKATRGEFNFDHPNAFDHQLLVNVIKKLTGKHLFWISNLIYLFLTNCKMPNFIHKLNSNLIDPKKCHKSGVNCIF